eukprot:scaffold2163_cov158-Ochromonas_danica.AAC.10
MDSILRDGVQLQAITARAFGGDSHFFEDLVTPEKIREELDSNKDGDKLKGMKQLLAMISKGRDVPEFFPDVVKNVVVKNIEDLSDPNQFVRGLALRVMTSVRVPDIIQIQLLAVRKCAGDTSPYVRKCAANAVTKIYAFDPEQIDHLKQILNALFKDMSTMVLGSTLAAFNEICPTAYEMIHAHYRKLCQLLADMDEWTQVAALDVLTRYVRNQFQDPSPGSTEVQKLQARQRSTAALKGQTTTSVRRKVKKQTAFYSDEEDEESEVEIIEVKPFSQFEGATENEQDLEEDHQLVLKCSLPLLKSRNTAVVLAVCTLHYYGGLPDGSNGNLLAKALVRIMRNRREVQYVVLNSIQTIARERPHLFRPYLHDFFVISSDAMFNRLLKLDILASLCDKDNVRIILSELDIYIKDPHPQFAAMAVKAVGRVADADPTVCESCITGLMQYLMCVKEERLVTECVVVLRQLLQQANSGDNQSVGCINALKSLIKLLLIDDPKLRIEEPRARACIVWLVGEFHERLRKVSLDVLRILASGFMGESTICKLQIMNLAAKLSVYFADNDKAQSLMTYVLELCRYDMDTDLRDRARMLTALMGLAPPSDDNHHIDEDALGELCEHAGAILLAPKLPPVTLVGAADDEGLPSLAMGSLSQVVGHTVRGYQSLGAWSTTRPNTKLRDTGSNRFEETSRYSEDIFKKVETESSSSAEESSDNEDSGSSDDDSESEDSEDSSEANSSSESEDNSSTASSSSASSSDRSSYKVQKFASKSSQPIVRNDDRNPSSQTRAPIRKVGRKRQDIVGLDSGLGSMTLQPSASTTTTSSFLIDQSGAHPSLSSSNLDNLLDLPHSASSVASQSSITGSTRRNHEMDMLGLGMNNSSGVDHFKMLSNDGPDLLDHGLMSSSASVPTVPAQASKVSNILSNFDVHPASTKSHTADVQPTLTGYAPLPSIPSTPMTAMHNPVPPANSSTVTSIDTGMLAPKVVLRPEIGAGLLVALVIRKNTPAVAYAGATSCYFSFRNTKEYAMRRIRISLPSDVRKTTISDIPLLEPGQEVLLPVEIVFTSWVNKSIKVDVRSDRGSFVGLLTVEDYDLLVPFVLSSEDFEMQRSRMKGFSEISKFYAWSAVTMNPTSAMEDLERELIQRVCRSLQMHVVQGVGLGELMFAAKVRKGLSEEKAFLTLLSQG